MKNVITAIAVFLITAGCSGKIGPYEGYYFGITGINENGDYSGLYDENDWQDAAGLSSVKVYPNPYLKADSDMTVEYSADAPYDYIEIRFESGPDIIDLQLEYNWSIDITDTSIVIDKSEFDELEPGYYRMYLTINNASVYGDILIK
ncbi:MAG: hypothetical protein ACLFP1_06535 [Candidatus Goldiibacteriota bacterium]